MEVVVQRFLDMIGRRPIGLQTQNEINVEFLTQMSGPQNNAALGVLFGRIPELTPAKHATFSAAPFAAGSYGQLYGSTADASRCFKVVQPANFPELFDIIKESFIQYVLSQDAAHGTSIPALFGIYRIGVIGVDEIRIVIEMQRATRDLFSYIASLQAQPLTFAQFRRIIQGVFTPLQHFNATYGYVHRDLKVNNVMMQRTGPGDLLANSIIKIIDFGFSCIRIQLNGVPYTIVSGAYYHFDTPCREQQDVLLFLYVIKNQFEGHGLLAPDVVAFINGFIPDEILGDRLPAKIAANPNDPPIFAAYNKNNALIGPLVDKASISIQRLINAVVAADANNEIMGGTRHVRSRRRKTKRRSRVNGRRRR